MRASLHAAGAPHETGPRARGPSAEIEGGWHDREAVPPREPVGEVRPRRGCRGRLRVASASRTVTLPVTRGAATERRHPGSPFAWGSGVSVEPARPATGCGRCSYARRGAPRDVHRYRGAGLVRAGTGLR